MQRVGVSMLRAGGSRAGLRGAGVALGQDAIYRESTRPRYISIVDATASLTKGTTMAAEKWLVDGEKVIDVDLVRNLKVTLIGGQVDIVGHDEPGARVEVHSVRGKALKVSIDGDTLEIDHPQLSWDNFIDVFASFKGSASADVSIMVPRDVALKFGVVSASALISGLADDARISTVTGDVVVDNHHGDLELNAVSGEIAVRNH